MLEANLMKEERSRNRRRHVNFVTRYSGNWRKPEHKTMAELRNKYGLKWLRVRMVYKRHENLKEMLLLDAHQKVMEGIFQKVTAPKICNCWKIQKINGTCINNQQW